MKKNVLALSIAAMVAGFAGSAYAVLPAAGAVDVAGATATELRFGNTGTGHMLVVPYFSTQNGNSTLLSIVNTNETVGKAVKVRFRGAANSDDIYDFQVFLSPGDVWTANISADPTTGLSTLTTNDNSCTKPAKSVLNSTPFVTSRLNGAATDEVKANNTREGYIEIFNMADIPSSSTGVYPAIKHSASGVPTCSGTAWTAINTDMSVGDLSSNGLTNPTTGLAANWTIINVPKAVAWSGAATAIEAVTGATPPALGLGNVVYFPQVSTNINSVTAGLYTADPLLQGATPVVKGALYDLPDMSTPYTTGAATPSQQAIDLSSAIAATSVMNEYWTDPSIHAATDWVFSMPTRRYAVAVNYGATGGPAMVQNPGNVNYFDEATNLQLNGDQICVKDITPSVWDREERQPAAPDDVVISPSTPGAPVLFCGETSVLSFNQAGAAMSGVLSASVALKDVGAYQDGWLKLNTPGAAATGLPILGQAFVAAFNPALPDGTSGHFNMGWEHRYTR